MQKILCLVILVALTSTVARSNPLYSYIPYSFGYQTIDGQSRHEQGNEAGIVSGSYSYTDANGDVRMVKYTADEHGFRPEGDISVDRRTAEAAAQLAALAPKGYPSQPSIVVPIGHWAGVPPSSHAIPAFQSFQKLMAAPPTGIPSWNGGYGMAHTVGTPAGFPPVPLAHPSSYSVDTPTHKIWFKY